MQRPNRFILRGTVLFLLPLMAAAAGDLAAVGLHRAFEGQSPSKLRKVSEIGWGLEALTVVIALVMLRSYWKQRNDPMISMGLAFGSWGIGLFLLLALEAGIAYVQVRSFSIEWMRAFGILTVRFAAGFIVMLLAHRFHDPLSDLVRRPTLRREVVPVKAVNNVQLALDFNWDEKQHTGRSWIYEHESENDGSTRAFFDSYDDALRILMAFDYALFAALAILEAARLRV